MEQHANHTKLEQNTMANAPLVSQEAVNMLTTKIWDTLDETWTPRDIFVDSPTERARKETIHDVDIEHFCAAVVHPPVGQVACRVLHAWSASVPSMSASCCWSASPAKAAHFSRFRMFDK